MGDSKRGFTLRPALEGLRIAGSGLDFEGVDEGGCGAVAERRAAGVLGGGSERSGAHAWKFKECGADGIPVLAGGSGVEGQVFGELLSSAEGFETEAGQWAIGA